MASRESSADSLGSRATGKGAFSYAAAVSKGSTMQNGGDAKGDGKSRIGRDREGKGMRADPCRAQSFKVDQSMVGVLLGKQGQTLKHLMAESCSTIDIDQSTHEHGYSVVHIKRGPGAAKARGLIDAKLREFRAQGRESATRWVPKQDCASNEEFSNRAHAKQSTMRKEVKVSQEDVAKLVGPKGTVCRFIEGQSGARLQFDQSTKHKGYSTLSIRGRDLAVSSAYKLVVARLSSAQTEMLSRRVPQEYIGALIGHKGENLHRIMDATGLRIEIDQSTRGKGYSTICIPDVEAAGKVQEMINEALAQLGYFDDGAMPKQPVETMNIDSYLADCVHGEHLRAIERDSGAALSLDETTWDEGYVVLKLEGSLRSVQKARKMVEGRMRAFDMKVKARGRINNSEQDKHAYEVEGSSGGRASKFDEVHMGSNQGVLSSKARVRKASDGDSSDMHSSRMSEKGEATPSQERAYESWDEQSSDHVQLEMNEHLSLTDNSNVALKLAEEDTGACKTKPVGSNASDANGHDANSETGGRASPIDFSGLVQGSPSLPASNGSAKEASLPSESSSCRGQFTPEKIAEHVRIADAEQVDVGSVSPRESEEHAENASDDNGHASVLNDGGAVDLHCSAGPYPNHYHDATASADDSEPNIASEDPLDWCEDTSWAWWAPTTFYDWSMMCSNDEHCWGASWYSGDSCNQWTQKDHMQSTSRAYAWPRPRARDSQSRAMPAEYCLNSLEGEWYDEVAKLSYKVVLIGTAVQVQILQQHSGDVEPFGNVDWEGTVITWEQPNKSKYALSKLGRNYIIWKQDGCTPLRWHRAPELKSAAGTDGGPASQVEPKTAQNQGCLEAQSARSTSRGKNEAAEMRVEQQYVSWIIGRAGGVIKDISWQTCTKMNFDQSTHAKGYSTLHITGPATGTKQALQLVAKRLDEAELNEKTPESAHRASSVGRHRTPPPTRSARRRERSREGGSSGTRLKKAWPSGGQDQVRSREHGTYRSIPTGASQMLKYVLQTLLGTWMSEDSNGENLVHTVELEPSVSGGAKLACNTWANESTSGLERPIRTERGDIFLGEDSRFYLDAITEKHVLWVDENKPEVCCRWARMSCSRRGGADGPATAGPDFMGSAARRNSGSRRGVRTDGRAPSLPARQRSREPRVPFSSVGVVRSRSSDVTLQRGSVAQNLCM
eukprot:TRINITY_DN14300_c0_g6_i1.p1 TRINITY_DN14300_c0_g6~~TRINITY_DN14300_c0_g6_i1.p1  ORF type:complete len:1179 (+),score=159.06 TRINITY_DN14300_c0_g6_i1:279-3815(+)